MGYFLYVGNEEGQEDDNEDNFCTTPGEREDLAFKIAKYLNSENFLEKIKEIEEKKILNEEEIIFINKNIFYIKVAFKVMPIYFKVLNILLSPLEQEKEDWENFCKLKKMFRRLKLILYKKSPAID